MPSMTRRASLLLRRKLPASSPNLLTLLHGNANSYSTSFSPPSNVTTATSPPSHCAFLPPKREAARDVDSQFGDTVTIPLNPPYNAELPIALNEFGISVKDR